jgi:hypothetical protein
METAGFLHFAGLACRAKDFRRKYARPASARLEQVLPGLRGIPRAYGPLNPFPSRRD